MRPPLPHAPLARAALVALTVTTLAVVGVLLWRATTTDPDRIPPGTTIAGVAVGGLTRAQAEQAVARLAGAPDGTITIARPGEQGFPLRVPVARLAPIPRARLAVDEAARERPFGQRLLREIGLGSDRDIPLDYRVEGATLNRLVADIERRLTRTPRDATVRVRDGEPVVVNGQPGQRVRTVHLKALLTRLPERLVVPVSAVAPTIDDDAALVARRRAERLTRGPVRVTDPRAGGVTLARATLLRSLTFTPTGARIAVGLNPDRIAGALNGPFRSLTRAPKSASFRVDGDRVAVVPGQVGRELDIAGVVRALERGSGPRSVRMRTTRVDPALTTDAARRMGIRELVSEFTTPYQCCQPRVTNIKRGAAILDGTIIPPDGTFSLNEVLGQRTTARGFVAAPQINAGQLEDAVGGGVSQIATTTFNAAFFAGLNLISHTPHEFWITRYPPGREATVSWGGPELIFQNDWPAAVLIKATATNDGITVRMYSRKLGRTVSTTTSGAGPAGTAFTVTYTRVVRQNGTVRRDERWTWSYKAPPAGH
ncbi:MAG TPA: VanW family protein [Miltoncostaeaceae bacterium]|nr:VanW family protein [Miltoncostaeaceae bacterium]